MKRTLKVDMPQVRAFSKTWELVNEFNWHYRKYETVDIPISRLIATQPSVKLKGLLTCDSDLRIFVVKIRGKYYIRDGHHRTMKAKILGEKTIAALVAEA